MEEINTIEFQKATSDKSIKEVYNYDLEAFAEHSGFEWSLENLKEDVKKNGWTLYSVIYDANIVAAAFVKEEKGKLLTKNTPIKMAYQGQGLSHQIKEFFEREAKQRNIKEVINYCPDDNFRLISLNESHGYTNLGQSDDNENVLKWSKKIK